MNILVTGGAGYIGSVLMRELLKAGHDIKCLDTLFFGIEPINDIENQIDIIEADIRTFDSNILKNIDVVMHLGAISRPDPTEEFDPQLYYEINHQGTSRLANLSKKKGVKRFIFSSTCSVYGFQDELITEESKPNPLEIYGKTKLLAEKDALKLSDDNFSVTILRNATVYGLSPKMRFDLVVNGMTWALQEFGTIKVMRDGTQWRPNVHVLDVVKAFMTVMNSDIKLVNGEIYNVGGNGQNYQIRPLAKYIGDSIGEPYKLDWYGEADTRSYRVDFTKIKEKLNFKIEHTVMEASKTIYDALDNGHTKKTEKTSNRNWYLHLINKNKLLLLDETK